MHNRKTYAALKPDTNDDAVTAIRTWAAGTALDFSVQQPQPHAGSLPASKNPKAKTGFKGPGF